MTFFTTIKDSIFSKDFVSQYEHKTFGSMFWFLFRLLLIQGAMITIAILIAVVPTLLGVSSKSLVDQYYPENLEVSIVNGEVTTNAEEPYFIANPDPEDEDEPANLLVIDTHTENALAAMDEYDSFAVLTHNSLVAQKSTGEIRVISLAEVEELQITKTTTEEFLQMMLPIMYAFLIALVVAMPFIIAFFAALLQLALLLIYTLITLLVARVHKIPLTYGKAYVLSGYLLTLPILLGIVLDLLPIKSQWFLTFAAFVAVVLINVRTWKTHTQPTSHD